MTCEGRAKGIIYPDESADLCVLEYNRRRRDGRMMQVVARACQFGPACERVARVIVCLVQCGFARRNFSASLPDDLPRSPGLASLADQMQSVIAVSVHSDAAKHSAD